MVKTTTVLNNLTNKIKLGYFTLLQGDMAIQSRLEYTTQEATICKGYLPTETAEKLFQNCCNEFWWVSPYAEKGLWRDELTYAKYMLDVVIREQLMKILTWYFGVKTGFKKASGKFGKYIRDDLEADVWKTLEETSSDANFQNIGEPLFAMGNLFRRFGNDAASHYRFKHPLNDDERVTKYLHRIKNLPPDATEI